MDVVGIVVGMAEDADTADLKIWATAATEVTVEVGVVAKVMVEV